MSGPTEEDVAQKVRLGAVLVRVPLTFGEPQVPSGHLVRSSMPKTLPIGSRIWQTMTCSRGTSIPPKERGTEVTRGADSGLQVSHAPMGDLPADRDGCLFVRRCQVEPLLPDLGGSPGLA